MGASKAETVETSRKNTTASEGAERVRMPATTRGRWRAARWRGLSLACGNGLNGARMRLARMPAQFISYSSPVSWKSGQWIVNSGWWLWESSGGEDISRKARKGRKGQTAGKAIARQARKARPEDGKRVSAEVGGGGTLDLPGRSRSREGILLTWRDSAAFGSSGPHPGRGRATGRWVLVVRENVLIPFF